MGSSPWACEGKGPYHYDKNNGFGIFFDSLRVVYNHYVPKGKLSALSTFIVIVLQEFLRQLKKERPNFEPGEGFLHWDNTLVHFAKLVEEYLAKRGGPPPPPNSKDLAPAIFFLFPKLKKKLAGAARSPEEFKK
jgi:hypothetical protein